MSPARRLTGVETTQHLTSKDGGRKDGVFSVASSKKKEKVILEGKRGQTRDNPTKKMEMRYIEYLLKERRSEGRKTKKQARKRRGHDAYCEEQGRCRRIKPSGSQRWETGGRTNLIY